MTSISSASLGIARSWPTWAWAALCGFVYWAVFLLVLEPDNLLRAHAAGIALPWLRETVRIAGAALLGACVAPLTLQAVERYSLLASRRAHHALIHAAINALLAAVLLVCSCFLANWVFKSQLHPSRDEILGELAANWTLVAFALCGFSLILSVLAPRRDRDALCTTPSPAPLGRLAIKMSGRFRHVEMASIDWLEAQGNYLAIHCGKQVHMLRQTMKAFEASRGGSQYVRVHRRTMVAVDRILDLKPLANGDAEIRLRTGQTLRVSRSYRDLLRQRWG